MILIKKENPIEVQLIDNSNGQTIGSVKMKPMLIPKTFSASTIHLYDRDWRIEEVAPQSPDDIIKSKKLVVKLCQVEQQERSSDKKRHLFSLFAFWVVILAVGAIFAYSLYTDGIKYPVELVGPERLRDAMYGVYAISICLLAVCVIWFFVWKSYWKNQKTFDETLTEQERYAPHSFIDSTLPISLHENLLRINYGFSIKTIDIGNVVWIHTYFRRFHRGLPSLMVCFYYKNHEPKTKAVFSHGNINGVYKIIDEIQNNKPSILRSRGFFSSEYKDCKRKYANK
jgi:hypothetical protein